MRLKVEVRDSSAVHCLTVTMDPGTAGYIQRLRYPIMTIRYRNYREKGKRSSRTDQHVLRIATGASIFFFSC